MVEDESGEGGGGWCCGRWLESVEAVGAVGVSRDVGRVFMVVGGGGLSLDLSVVGASDWRGLVVVQAVTSAE